MADKPLTEQEVRDKLVRNLRWHSRDHRSNPYTELTANAADEIERLQQRLAEAERERQFAVDRADVELDRRRRAEQRLAEVEAVLAHAVERKRYISHDEIRNALKALDREDT